MNAKPDWRDKVSDFSQPSDKPSNPIWQTTKSLYLWLLVPPALALIGFASGPKNNFNSSFGSFMFGLILALAGMLGYCIYAFFAIRDFGKLNLPTKWYHRLIMFIPIFIMYSITSGGILFFLPTLLKIDVVAIDYISLIFGIVVATVFVVILNHKYVKIKT